MTKLTKLVTVVAGVAAVSCTAVSSLCAALSCDEFCEVSMTPSGVSVAHCACDVGYTRVRVTGSQRCNSQYLERLLISYKSRLSRGLGAVRNLSARRRITENLNIN